MWNKAEIDYLKKFYPSRGKKHCMDYLSKTDGAIRNKASDLGLVQDRKSKFFISWQKRAAETKIGKKRPEHSKFMKKYIAESKTWTYWSEKRRSDSGKKIKKFIDTKGHPKGMLGKTHSKQIREAISSRFKSTWANPTSKFNSKEYRQGLSDRMSKIMQNRIINKGSIYSRSHNGWYVLSNKSFYFRSSWEVIYARYLEWLKINKKIIDWQYEPETFWFEKIKRGVRSYRPDFRINNLDNSIEYHEVKGWLDDKSKTKMKRMKKYYPSIKLILIDKYIYKDISKLERMYPEAIKKIN